jgi:sulfite exporter TauE/SafE/copper chaperone CopZ
MKKTLPISGMKCKSCEIILEKTIKKVQGVKEVKVSYVRSEAEIDFHAGTTDHNPVIQAIHEAGYKIGAPSNQKWFTQDMQLYQELSIAFFIFGLLYFIIVNLGAISFNPDPTGDSSSLLMVLIIGLTAGFSSCMALVGGLILGLSARHAEKHPEALAMQKFRPHIFFQIGRVLGYGILGGLLGLFSGWISLSGTFLGMITLLVGLLMLVLGIQILEISPRFNRFKLTMPKSISRFLGIYREKTEYNHKKAFLLGALTFFLPCGFTLSMQALAIESGSVFQGSLIMSTFALGTAPGLLGLGGAAAIAKGAIGRIFFKLTGIVVIAFAIFNIINSSNLLGINFHSFINISNNNSSQTNTVSSVTNNQQIITMNVGSAGYRPNRFTVVKNIPVVWKINVENPYTCATSLIVPDLDVNKNLKKGENVIEFIPSETGEISFSCSMGMYTGSILVVNEK